MTTHLYIEPPKAGEEESLQKRLHDSLLQVPGIKRLYPRQPLLIKLGKGISAHQADSASVQAEKETESSPAEQTASSGKGLTLLAQLGLEDGVRVPDVVRQAAEKLAQECPGASIKLEVVSCS